MAIRWEDLPAQAQARVEATQGPLRLLARQPRKRKATRKHADLEQALATQLRMVGAPDPLRQYRFHPTRRWRFDLAWPDRNMAVEVDGGTWTGGGHVRGKHYESDCEKGNEAILLGWRVMHVTTDMVSDGRAVAFIERFLMG